MKDMHDVIIKPLLSEKAYDYIPVTKTNSFLMTGPASITACSLSTARIILWIAVSLLLMRCLWSIRCSSDIF